MRKSKPNASRPEHDGHAARTVEVRSARGWGRKGPIGHEVNAVLNIQTVPDASVDESKYGRGILSFSIERFSTSTFSRTGEESFSCEVNRLEIDSLIAALEGIRDIGDAGNVWPQPAGGTGGGIRRKHAAKGKR